MSVAKNILTDFAKKADIEVNGNRPWDIQVHDERFYGRVLRGGSLALGESYMDGWWDAESLDEFFAKVTVNGEHEGFVKNPLVHKILSVYTNLQSKARAFEVGEKHYDLDNDLYEKMLDKRMVYTCADWRGVDTLDAAQEQKLDLICKKIGLKEGDTVLDIGCGFGGFAKYAAEKYGAKVTGITVSKEQKKKAEEVTKGLSVEIVLTDYRDFKGTFDHVVSIEMFEAVGVKNFRVFMEKVHSFLKPGGLFLLQTIGNNVSSMVGEAWLDKYIFPNGILPSLKQVGESVEDLFVTEDVFNFGADYDPTLMAWFKNFDDAWDSLKDKYDERFYRMWKYYLLSCAGAFRSRNIQDWQFVFSKGGVVGGYTRV